MAKAGLPCDEIPRDIVPGGYWAHIAVMSQKNGKFRKVIIPSTENVVFYKELLKAGDEIKDFRATVVAQVRLEFASYEELRNYVLYDYKGIKVEVTECELSG